MGKIKKLKESEKVTEKYLARRLIEVGGKSFKWVSPGYRGVVDRICFFPPLFKGQQGKVFFIEVKSQGEQVRPEQARFLDMLQDTYGQTCVVVSTKLEVDAIIDSFKEAQSDIQSKIASTTVDTIKKPKGGIIIPGR